ncbi:MAG: hypothetical protein KBT57_00790, partial [bacterium]|nr:hypothetical protein [Candidatus Limimorpha equi]
QAARPKAATSKNKKCFFIVIQLFKCYFNSPKHFAQRHNLQKTKIHNLARRKRKILRMSQPANYTVFQSLAGQTVGFSRFRSIFAIQ